LEADIPDKVKDHCKAVSELAGKIAEALNVRGALQIRIYAGEPDCFTTSAGPRATMTLKAGFTLRLLVFIRRLK
jgi:hypothetical protein